MSPNPDFGPALLHQLCGVCKSANKGRLTTGGYTAVCDRCLKGNKGLCGHPIASEESRKVSKYHDRKRAIKIRSGSERIIYSRISVCGAPEKPASRELTIPWTVKSGSRLVCHGHPSLDS
ncbi:hypothetical protein RF11_12595 [Thelohanellus kitauei]|uniref:Uncharacterized protein n=1 Tax=Thelohanellus kitauei TaxID=669202 RepID=A0A0C2IY57_THEKT|nr:hypothetical protein RF11_12595 [Thelohanellus kitauei]